MIRVAGVFVYRGKAYVPTEALLEGGGTGTFMVVEPIYTADLTVNDLTNVLEGVATVGHPVIPEPRILGYPPNRDPVLRVAKVRSWRQLARSGASYTIIWEPDAIVLYISRLDRQSRFETDEAKTRKFSPDTPIRSIVEAIVLDAESRPELLSSPTGR